MRGLRSINKNLRVRRHVPFAVLFGSSNIYIPLPKKPNSMEHGEYGVYGVRVRERESVEREGRERERETR